MCEEVVIEWERVSMSGVPLDHWLARVHSPARSVVFASVNQTLRGDWKVNFTPKGRGIDKPITYVTGYKTLEKAQRHIERWGRAHWRTLPPWVPPACRIGQSQG
jgi:hypothetical protein